MANTYFGTSRGVLGYGTQAITVGTSSTATLDFELRVANLDQQGNVPTRKDVEIAIQNLRDFILGNLPGGASDFPPL